ncbi:copper homeostasis periplasmic binding protein CopC [Roseomonas sp. E05]|uniref:copper homeostasis periplasmic binding protein CopC n=1 Tax=Roseomonas sp. E05 TaxID=3046310 RepID=UPI0024BA428B|nr:copper homeostasis periplasmic binding protein CopC [Roseomonas sp. E05]MDJ0390952.1 copper homeostasis periplasmic binding protein CopC [Roseomonas sp. E05]
MSKTGLGAVSAVLGLLLATPAFAHAHLTAAEPAGNASVSSPPGALQLHFSEGLELEFSGVRLLGADGTAVPTGKPSLAPNDDRTLSVPLQGVRTPGPYVVEWHVLSTDGHTTHGTYRFTVAP